MKETGAVGKWAGVAPSLREKPVRCAALRNPGNGSRTLRTVKLNGSILDPLDKIPITYVVGGRYSNWDFTLPYGEVIHDYLKAEEIFLAGT